MYINTFTLIWVMTKEFTIKYEISSIFSEIKFKFYYAHAYSYVPKYMNIRTHLKKAIGNVDDEQTIDLNEETNHWSHSPVDSQSEKMLMELAQIWKDILEYTMSSISHMYVRTFICTYIQTFMTRDEHLNKSCFGWRDKSYLLRRYILIFYLKQKILNDSKMFPNKITRINIHIYRQTYNNNVKQVWKIFW